MGAGGSVIQQDEKELLESFTSSEAWPFDSDKWQNFLRWKVAPYTVPPAQLQAELQQLATRLVQQRSNRNLSTLAAHIALRLPKAWFFSRSDVWMTTTAVTLLRLFIQQLLSKLPFGEVVSFLQDRPNAAASTPHVQLEGYAWPDLIASALDFLASGVVDSYSYDLHVAVIELLLVLFSPQAANGEPLLRGVDIPPRPAFRPSAADVSELQQDAALDAALQQLRTGTPGSPAMSDAFLRASMVLGGYRFSLDTGAAYQPRNNNFQGGIGGALQVRDAAASSVAKAAAGGPVGASDTSTPSKQSRAHANAGSAHPFSSVAGAAEAVFASRAHLLTRALLRNVAIDAPRTDESDTPGPSDASIAGRASLLVSEQRAKALAAHDAAAAAPPSALSTVLGTVASAAGAVASLPVTLITDVVAPGPGEPVGKPLSERSALLLLLLLHNCRALTDSPSGGLEEVEAQPKPGAFSAQQKYLANPYRVCLESLVDNGLKEVNYNESSTANAILRSAGLPAASSSTPGSAAVAAVPGAGNANLQLLGVSFKQLFTSLASMCGSGPLGTALLYTLQHGCAAWRAHTLSRTDIDLLLVPVLSQLYRLDIQPHDDRYMSLITLMMFTQDSAFCETSFRRVKLRPAAVAWYRERRLGDISLGSLMLLILHRTAALVSVGAGEVLAGTTAPGGAVVGANAGASVEPHALSTLHQNIFAACANLSPHAEGLHPVTCQRALGTLAALHKKHKKAESKLQALLAAAGATQDSPTVQLTSDLLPAAAAALGLPTGSDQESVRAAIYKLNTIADILGQSITIGLESLLASVAPSLLPRNTHLLYALLRDSATIEGLAADTAFSEAASPLKDLVHYVTSLVERAQTEKALEAALSGSLGAAEAEELRALKAQQDSAAAPSAAAPATASSSSMVAWHEDDVLRVLSSSVKSGSWPGSERAAVVHKDCLSHIFEYREAASPEAFFVPYFWAVAYGYCRASVGWAKEDVRGALLATAGGASGNVGGAAAAGSSGGVGVAPAGAGSSAAGAQAGVGGGPKVVPEYALFLLPKGA